MSTRLRAALVVLGATAMLVTACSGSSTPSSTAPAGSTNPSTSKAPAKIKVTLITKATGGFWDAMIAGAKKYAADNPTQVELTTLACKTNDDTPCQIAEIQDTVTKGAQALVISPMGPGVIPALTAAQQARFRRQLAAGLRA